MSKRLERRFVALDTISRHLFCSICTDVFLDPTRLCCGHTFCKKCITHWTHGNKTCPICRARISLRNSGKDLIADNMIRDLPVTCTNQQCNWTNSLSELPEHYKNCEYTELPKWVEETKNIIEIDDTNTSEARNSRPRTARLTIPSLYPENRLGSFSELPQHNLSPTNIFQRLLLMPPPETNTPENIHNNSQVPETESPLTISPLFAWEDHWARMSLDFNRPITVPDQEEVILVDENVSDNDELWALPDGFRRNIEGQRRHVPRRTPFVDRNTTSTRNSKDTRSLRKSTMNQRNQHGSVLELSEDVASNNPRRKSNKPILVIEEDFGRTVLKKRKATVVCE